MILPNGKKSLAEIEEKWYSFYPPETFSYKFYDEALEAIYVQERNLSKLINLTTAIAIVISCLGLFGLASLTAFQRTKEIGIRKVMGAETFNIVTLLGKDFMKLVFFGFLIAVPISWYGMSQWLEDFAFRIGISWQVFLIAGLVAGLIAAVTVSGQAIKAALANPVKSIKNE